jgi:hypothetical protein
MLDSVESELFIESFGVLRCARDHCATIKFFAGRLDSKLRQLPTQTGTEMIFSNHSPAQRHSIVVIQSDPTGSDDLTVNLDSDTPYEILTIREACSDIHPTGSRIDMIRDLRRLQRRRKETL